MPNASVEHRQYEYPGRNGEGTILAVQPRFVTEFGGIGPVVVDSSCGCNMCKIEDKWQISVATPCATVALAIDLHVTRPVGAANDQFCSALGREANR
jgi:hypothetical protein